MNEPLESESNPDWRILTQPTFCFCRNILTRVSQIFVNLSRPDRAFVVDWALNNNYL